jgi:hypothetical protein
VRRARHQVLSNAMSNPRYESRESAKAKKRILRILVRLPFHYALSATWTAFFRFRNDSIGGGKTVVGLRAV